MLALKGGKVYTATDGVIESGTILIDRGKIVDVGAGISVPAKSETVDLRGKYILPGLIDPGTRLGIREEGNGAIGWDDDESTNPVTPHLRASDATWPEDIGFKDALEAGVTTVGIGPATTNVFCGQTFAAKTTGRTVKTMTLRDPAGMQIALTGTPRGGPPWAQPSGPPRDRPQDVAIFQAELQRAREYAAKTEKERNPKSEAVAALLRKEFPAVVRCVYNHDLTNAIELARAWGFDLIIDHAIEGQLVLDEIKRSGAPVIAGPLMVNRRNDFKNLTFRLPAILAAAGVKVALTTDHPVVPIRYLLVQAAVAVREGMSEEDAVRAITINPAEILGVADRVGSIEPGKDADLAVYDGHPFDTLTNTERVYVNGRVVYNAARPAARRGGEGR
ncbi:MAG: amidohydrolase family protein [Bacillota bacterium]